MTTDNSRLVFLHIPKCAGTAFHKLLMRHYAPADLCPERLGCLNEMPDEEIGKYRIYSGHYHMDQITRIPQPRRVITLLREPRKRLLSLYNYFHAHRLDVIEQYEKEGRSGIQGVRLAKQLDLLTYLQRPEAAVKRYVQNAITRHLIGLKYIALDGELTISEDDACAIAIQNLEGLSAFGAVERYPESRQILSAATGFELPAKLPQDNTFDSLRDISVFEEIERKETFTDEAEAEIKRNTSIDDRVYAWAVTSILVTSKDGTQGSF